MTVFGKNKSNNRSMNTHIGFDVVHFTLDELRFLNRYGKGMLALYEGRRRPSTLAQSKFIQACKGKRPITQYYEVIFMKFLLSGWKIEEVDWLCRGQFHSKKKLSKEYEVFRYGSNPPNDLDREI